MYSFIFLFNDLPNILYKKKQEVAQTSNMIYIQVHLNKLECRGKLIYFSNSTQIVKLMY